MKQALFIFLAFLLPGISACEWENEETLFAEAEACSEKVLFSTHIAPIIKTNCAYSGCHVAGGKYPDLSSYEKVKAVAADVQHETQSGSMPPSFSDKSLSQEEIELIACWVEQGTKRD